ncbi:MAG: hypothetical protein ACFB5Z_06695 [Elainellaceae cyanobacterium]
MTLQPSRHSAERPRRWWATAGPGPRLVAGLAAAGLAAANLGATGLGAIAGSIPQNITALKAAPPSGSPSGPSDGPPPGSPDDPPSTGSEISPLRPVTTCPNDFEQMTQAMLQDLPDYANRVLARSRTTPAADVQTHIALSGPATYAEAIPGPRWDGPTSSKLAENGLQQVFFTTLERQYVGETLTSLQHYHWALIARTARGWQLAGLFSRLAGYPADQPSSPFLETTYGDVGQAIDLWLRDCEAGAIEGR